MSNDGVAKLPPCTREARGLSDDHGEGIAAVRHRDDAVDATDAESRTWGGFDTLPVPAYWRVAASTSSLDIVVVSTTLHLDINLE